MTYDVAAVRSLFPALLEGAAHFDGPGGSQTPTPVAEAVRDTLVSAISNRGDVTASERRAESVVVEARAAMADLLGADPRGVIFGRSATALTYDLSRALARTWKPGDEVIVTRLDHDSNIRPWVQAAESVGAVVKWADFEPETGELHSEAVTSLITERTRLVATSAASNLIGTKPPVCKIARAVHEVGALHWVDGVHSTAHASVDLEVLGVDFWTCSPYKFLGPHLGVVAASPALLETLTMDKLLPSSDAVPERFELGTLPYELLAGVTAAVDVLAGLDPSATGSRRERILASFDALAGARAPTPRPARSRTAGYAGCAALLECSQTHADRSFHRGREVAPGGAPGSRRERRQRASRALLRDRGLTPPGVGRRGWRPGRTRALHRQQRHRPPADGPLRPQLIRDPD